MSDPASEALRRIQSQLTGVVAMQVAGTDGRSEAHTLEPSNIESTAAVAASSLQLGRRLSDLLGDGELSELTVRSSDGYVIVYSIDESWILTVLTVPSANIARINLACRDLRTELAGMLRSSTSQ